MVNEFKYCPYCGEVLTHESEPVYNDFGYIVDWRDYLVCHYCGKHQEEFKSNNIIYKKIHKREYDNWQKILKAKIY